MRGRRVVLAASGLWLLLLSAKTDPRSIAIKRWVSRKVIPETMHEGYLPAANVEEMVSGLLRRIGVVDLHILANAGGTLADLVGTEVRVDLSEEV
jgi:hypothetical protein